jgi:hypothetical protein
MRFISLGLGGSCLYGDNHVIVLGTKFNGAIA